LHSITGTLTSILPITYEGEGLKEEKKRYGKERTVKIATKWKQKRGVLIPRELAMWRLLQVLDDSEKRTSFSKEGRGKTTGGKLEGKKIFRNGVVYCHRKK